MFSWTFLVFSSSLSLSRALSCELITYWKRGTMELFEEIQITNEHIPHIHTPTEGVISIFQGTGRRKERKCIEGRDGAWERERERDGPQNSNYLIINVGSLLRFIKDEKIMWSVSSQETKCLFMLRYDHVVSPPQSTVTLKYLCSQSFQARTERTLQSRSQRRRPFTLFPECAVALSHS